MKRAFPVAYTRLLRVAFATDEQARAFDLACEARDPGFTVCPAVAKVVAGKVGRQVIEGARVVCEPGMVAVWPTTDEEPLDV